MGSQYVFPNVPSAPSPDTQQVREGKQLCCAKQERFHRDRTPETYIRVLFGLPSICSTFKNQQFHKKSRLSASVKISDELAMLSQP